MSKSGQARYESQRKKDDYTFHPARTFELIWSEDPGDCVLLALDHRQLSLLREMCAVFPKYHWVWGLPSPRRDWDAATHQQWHDISDFIEELEATLLSGCDLQAFIDAQTEQTRAIRELTAAVASVSIDTTQPVPANVDYTDGGLAGKFRTHNIISPDQDIADILANSLFGRYIDPVPNPFEGDGIADILDDRIQETLERCFVMPDSSIWNLFGTKNVPETLETLLRIDSVFDLEILSNITSVLDSALNTGDATVIGLFKKLISRLVADLQLPPETKDWLETILETEERLGHADILLMLAMAEEKGGGSTIAKAIKGMNQTINLNNYNGCCDEEDCNCSDAETQTFNLLDLCEQEDVPVNGAV